MYYEKLLDYVETIFLNEIIHWFYINYKQYWHSNFILPNVENLFSPLTIWEDLEPQLLLHSEFAESQ